MRQYELVERVTSYDPTANEALLNKAYVYAMKAHGQQTRASGDPYFSHPLEVAAILTELKLDDATIAAALLHDTIEDTGTTRDEIDDLFGAEIGSLVDGLTKIGQLDLVSKEAAQAENLRKLLLAVSDDIRVLLVKLADRLHNMRTLEFVPEQKRLRIAQETLDIYAPLAGRMGMQQMRDELEDHSFAVLNPEARDTILSRLETLREESGELLIEIEAALTEALSKMGIEARVQGREKRPYSIWRKMERKTIALGQLSDIFGFRAIVETIDECYRALGCIHQTWRMVPGRFKDYISNPRQNDYQSIHTTVIGPRHARVELQIRTHTMHDVAERGVAAHALYKDATNGSGGAVPLSKTGEIESNAYRWLRRLVEMLEEGDSPEEFLEHTKLELFHDQVFCFTPKGHLIALPRGATAIDFAYAVHTDIGDSCVGCRINGRQAPLISELDNGDEVDVICSEAQTPPAAWEAFAVTGKARAAIRRATRSAVRKQYAGLGREILQRVFAREGVTFDEDAFSTALPRLGLTDVEDALSAVGRGKLASAEVLKALDGSRPKAKAKTKAKKAPEGNGSEGRSRDSWFSLDKAIKLAPRLAARNLRLGGRKGEAGKAGKAGAESSSDKAIPVRGHGGDLPIRFAPGSGTVPGDRIVGIVTPDEGIIVYPIESEVLQQFEDQPERWVDLTWDLDEGERVRFPAHLSVILQNEPGALAQIAQVIGATDGNISNLAVVSRANDFFEFQLELEVWDLKHLNRILSELRRKAVVSSASRLRD